MIVTPDLLRVLSLFFAPKVLEGTKLPGHKEVRDKSIFILRSGADKLIYMMIDGQWEIISQPSAISLLDVDTNEIEFDYTMTSTLIFTNGATQYRLIQILIDITTVFTSGARMKIISPSKTILYDTDVIITQKKVTPKFLNYILTAGDTLTLQITGSPTAGAGKILLIKGTV